MQFFIADSENWIFFMFIILRLIKVFTKYPFTLDKTLYPDPLIYDSNFPFSQALKYNSTVSQELTQASQSIQRYFKLKIFGKKALKLGFLTIPCLQL